MRRWIFSGLFDEVSLPCGGLELDAIVSFDCGLDGIAFTVLDGGRADAGAGKAACSAASGVDGNRRGFPITPFTGDNKVASGYEALE